MSEENEKDILEDVLAEFQNLAAIPRPSGHEKKVSDFLKDRLTQLGCKVTQDSVNNIIADVPATKGHEKAPLTILQGHMDMVCVAEHGRAYDPLNDPIHLVRKGDFLYADGTSLGADDGIGVAIAIHVARTAKVHGPIRLLITVDEERGMTGTVHLSPKHLEGASFLINCDSESYDELTVGSAGSVDLGFRKTLSRKALTQKDVYQLEVKGFVGGHSGECIGLGRGNAIRTMALALLALMEKGKVELVWLDGGTARNAIPSAAKAIFATSLTQAEIESVLADQKERFLSIYGNVDVGIEFALEKTVTEYEALTLFDAYRLLRLLTVLHTGTYAMSTVIPGLVETSANLGVVRMEEGVVAIEFFPRSSIDAKVDEFRTLAEAVGELTGFTVDIGTQSPGWKERKDSRLAEIMTKVYEEQNGKKMKVSSIHAGLECGWHVKKNPALDMVSVGVTTHDIHSPNEHLDLTTVAPEVLLIEKTLEKIAAL